MNSKASILNPLGITETIRQFLTGCCFALPLLFAQVASAQSVESGVSMKMTEHLNSIIGQGIATLNNAQRRSNAVPSPTPVSAPAPVATKLKMDKINSRFVEKQDVIFDRISNLTWSRCSLGQRWDNSKGGCVGSVRQLSYDQALMRTNEQWRLPTREELATLIDRTKKNNPESMAIDRVAFPDMDPDKLIYWSSNEENNSFAWAVLFGDTGIPGILYRSHRFAIRLVHSGA